MFTVLAFASLDNAARRFHIVSLAGPRHEALEALRDFDVSVARCYDPNEQQRLMGVISVLGRERFNKRIHALAESLLERLRRRDDSTSTSFGQWTRSGQSWSSYRTCEACREG